MSYFLLLSSYITNQISHKKYIRLVIVTRTITGSHYQNKTFLMSQRCEIINDASNSYRLFILLLDSCLAES